jgi:phosphate acyltransferase
MKIGLDVMGGDFAPQATMRGAELALDYLDQRDKIFLIGNEEVIASRLADLRSDTSRFEIIHASQIIDMGEKPLKALTNKPDSSIAIGYKLLKSRTIDGFCSAGNSGAFLVGAMYSIGTIPGVIRPTSLAHIPQENGGESIILDVGTNPDIKPDVMYQFALLGSIYSREVLKTDNPRVGLLNIGTEEGKGNLLCQATYQMMKDSKDFNFIGNVESRDMYKSKVDVIVCDGFTGNIVLKQVEAMYRLLQKRQLLDDYMRRFNYEIYGGSPVLGVNAPVVMGHGISSAEAIKNMILLSKKIHKAKLSKKIIQSLDQFTR